MLEVEVKILEIDKDYIIAKLEELWAEKIFDWEISAEFFRNDAGKKVRLRKQWSKNLITYKEKEESDNYMVNKEYEVSFKDYSVMVWILEWIGFVKYWTSKKYRITYKMGNIKFDIDKYDDIPWLMEIESTNSREVEYIINKLGYTMVDTKLLTERQVKEFYWVSIS